MPTSSAADSMQLHYPSYGLGGAGGVPYGYGSVDHMTGRLGPQRSPGYLDASAPGAGGYGGHRMPYAGGAPPTSAHPNSAGHYMPSGVPMSAPGVNGYAGGAYHGAPVYAQSPPPPGKYYGSTASDAPSGAGTSTPGSNYGTPQ
jgi:hypothetical protein